MWTKGVNFWQRNRKVEYLCSILAHLPISEPSSQSLKKKWVTERGWEIGINSQRRAILHFYKMWGQTIKLDVKDTHVC